MHGGVRRLSIRLWYQKLAEALVTADWRCLNLGLMQSESNQLDRYGIETYAHLARLVPLADQTVLELGCGRGGGAAWLAQQGPKSLSAVDIVPGMVEAARQLAPTAALEVADAERLPFADQSFDVALEVESSHGFGSFERALDELWRVLRPRGHLAMIDFRSAMDIEAMPALFDAAGFEVLQQQDLTASALQALSATDPERLARQASLPPALAERYGELAALPNSSSRALLGRGELRYQSWLVRKQ